MNFINCTGILKTPTFITLFKFLLNVNQASFEKSSFCPALNVSHKMLSLFYILLFYKALLMQDIFTKVLLTFLPLCTLCNIIANECSVFN